MGGDRRRNGVIPSTGAREPGVTTRSGHALDLPADSPLRGLAGRPTLVVFLRSFGCTFCREAMADVAAAKDAIRDAGAQIAFVHGASPTEATPWFEKYGLEDVTIVSDPTLVHYKAFGLGRASTAALVAPRVWMRGAVCALSHGFGMQTASMMRQLPGVFVVEGDRVRAEYRHRTGADRPDYLALVQSATR
jgi:hypothetical protein